MMVRDERGGAKSLNEGGNTGKSPRPSCPIGHEGRGDFLFDCLEVFG